MNYDVYLYYTKTQKHTIMTFDEIKPTGKRTKETYDSLKLRGYKTANETDYLNTLSSNYLFSEKEGRLFYCRRSGECTEIVKIQVIKTIWKAN